ncbi:MAG: hypothetical protein A2921_00830 [Candidatus Magasanikbacteria bacterium RIFCSPLOWO2_01_FULL_43_20b]|uniref:Uncharacterized protein n=1 Tax=Candidatus Magasanikbacteria bacterium RIFCSPLOWO2_12_FULL_43_12 TaxID=1798692 RepID=A0A1F6MVC8_9BACT|nr:MAG: hypothetical protein A3I93_00550 [Candidatus Magasanikbacteria bacterium RIFCSPLOWO2_02_FULL_43_22]OGH72823.1 MAG: hypothetical protein A2921_00830 [Candidatus Magasanikbacteria bacterium RIFCSPLOWO2_01_FULL_43_20b]OGH75619.1 MAG: hypothetical protein A3G00_03945 [Candidatus Magasanikbacteria bacterium RIFCSPLOWO2_12_FULL_43_12]
MKMIVVANRLVQHVLLHGGHLQIPQRLNQALVNFMKRMKPKSVRTVRVTSNTQKYVFVQ